MRKRLAESLPEKFFGTFGELQMLLLSVSEKLSQFAVSTALCVLDILPLGPGSVQAMVEYRHEIVVFVFGVGLLICHIYPFHP